MIISEVIHELESYGLTKEEALMYCYLLQEKSATIRDIHESKYFAKKKRPNLYKILKNLQKKQFIFEEEKEKSKRFFPHNPHNTLNLIIQERTRQLSELDANSADLILKLDQIIDQPNEKFEIMPPFLKQFVEDVKPIRWIIKEIPEILDRRGMETIMSLEFDTRHSFQASSAGFVLYEYRYEEHLLDAIGKIVYYQQEQFKEALQNVENHIPFRFDSIQFNLKNKALSVRGNFFSYIELEVKAKLFGIIRGGFTVLRLEDFPKILLSLWSPNFEDFKILFEHVAKKYPLDPIDLAKYSGYSEDIKGKRDENKLKNV